MSYKVLTHDFRSPLQGGNPVWDGTTLPFTLPKVKLNVGPEACAPGWYYGDSLRDALRIAGLWPDGRPALCLRVEPSADAIKRDGKLRCSELTITGRVPLAEVHAAIREMSEQPFGVHAGRMADSQIAWYEALGRPRRNVRDIKRGLRVALATRRIPWKLHRYENARDAQDAWAAWSGVDGWIGQPTWSAPQSPWSPRQRAAGISDSAWRAALAAWAGLTIEHKALSGRIKDDPLLRTAGIRDAYAAGLEVVVPVAEGVLGWA